MIDKGSCKDEARVGQQGTLTRIWAKRSTRPRIRCDRRFTWAYLFGAICPARGTSAALVMPYRRHEPTSGRNQQMRQRQPFISSTVLVGTVRHNSSC